MKRWLWYGAALALILALSAESYGGSDVGKMQAVQTVRVSGDGGAVMLETDTGEQGKGAVLGGAFEDLKKTASAELLFDTAEYLLIAPGCERLLPELMEYLRPSCCVCIVEGEADLTQAGEYLQTHVPELTLMEYRAGRRDLPVLKVSDGRMALVK